jgi:hypothetical protein
MPVPEIPSANDHQGLFPSTDESGPLAVRAFRSDRFSRQVAKRRQLHLSNTRSKTEYPTFPPLLVHIIPPKIFGVTCLAMQSRPIGDGDHEPAVGSNGSFVPRGRNTRFGSCVDRCAIDGRTTRHSGYSVSQRIRKRIEEAFGWVKTVAGQEKTKYRGRERVGWAFTFAVAAYNLTRLPKLMAPA